MGRAGKRGRASGKGLRYYRFMKDKNKKIMRSSRSNMENNDSEPMDDSIQILTVGSPPSPEVIEIGDDTYNFDDHEGDVEIIAITKGSEGNSKSSEVAASHTTEDNSTSNNKDNNNSSKDPTTTPKLGGKILTRLRPARSSLTRRRVVSPTDDIIAVYSDSEENETQLPRKEKELRTRQQHQHLQHSQLQRVQIPHSSHSSSSSTLPVPRNLDYLPPLPFSDGSGASKYNDSWTNWRDNKTSPTGRRRAGRGRKKRVMMPDSHDELETKVPRNFELTPAKFFPPTVSVKYNVDTSTFVNVSSTSAGSSTSSTYPVYNPMAIFAKSKNKKMKPATANTRNATSAAKASSNLQGPAKLASIAFGGIGEGGGSFAPVALTQKNRFAGSTVIDYTNKNTSYNYNFSSSGDMSSATTSTAVAGPGPSSSRYYNLRTQENPADRVYNPMTLLAKATGKNANANNNNMGFVNNANAVPAAPVASTSTGSPELALSAFGGNLFAPKAPTQQRGTLRPIVIDGSNVAMAHGNNQVFSCRGIKICVDFFKQRGHETIIAFVPHFKTAKGQVSRMVDAKILEELEAEGIVKTTPGRRVENIRIASYDDRFIVQSAAQIGGVIISNDQYRDLYKQEPSWRETIHKRVLQYVWVTPDMFMVPDDPLGRGRPQLDEILRF